MTSNDKQIDVLLRRYAKAAPRTSVTGHLDADEISAFAEGALPPATRASFVSHLADCDQCRKQASALAISSGAVARTDESPSLVGEGRTFWQLLAGMFALPVLRYAAFGAVLLIVAGVAFVALRRPRSERQLVVANEPINQQRESAIKPRSEIPEGTAGNKQANAQTRSASPSQLPADGDQTAKANTASTAEDAPAKPLPMKEAPADPVTAEKKAEQGEIAKAAPSYAPIPPGDTATQQKQEAYRQTQIGSGISGPRQQQQKLDLGDKVASQERERDANKDVARNDDLARKSGAPASVASNQPPPSPRRAVDEKAKGPMRNMESNTLNRNENIGRVEAPKTTSASGADRASTEEAPQTRSAGGRKFRRQGAAWVDQKFKSSMTLKSVSRGSDEFAGLDSALRSIAQQLGGEVIVVWKGKAYLIK